MDLDDEPMDEGPINEEPCETLTGLQGEDSSTQSLLRPGSMVMMTITQEDYEQEYWPKLETAIQQLLTMTTGEYIPISYEQMYSCVYKCVCKGYPERLYKDLIEQITHHLEKVNLNIEASDSSKYINQFHNVLNQYMQALNGIVPIFNYMNRFHVITRLRTDLNIELLKLFVDIVADRHVPKLIAHLVSVTTKPFQVPPDTMSTLIRNIYELNAKYVELHPTLFAKFIPSVLPRCEVGNIDMYIEETRHMQADLKTHPSFTLTSRSLKRSGDDDSSVSSAIPCVNMSQSTNNSNTQSNS